MAKHKILKVRESVPGQKQGYLHFVRRFDEMAEGLKFTGFTLYDTKEEVVWINPKAKAGSHDLNFYAFDRRDYSELNQILNRIARREVEMREKGYDLAGLKSFNRNVWLDLSRNSNAIEGIFEDFDPDLLDFRTKLRGEYAIDPQSEDFEIFTYFQRLTNQLDKVAQNNDSVVIEGKHKRHTLSLATVRHFVAFKYIYKCAKKDMRHSNISPEDFASIIHYVASLLAGQDFVTFRKMPVGVKGAEWVVPNHEKVDDKISALCQWVINDKGAKKLHPIEQAAIFAAEFIRIHPFMDGNGRTSRILTNYIMIKNEMPAIAVRGYQEETKNEYFEAMNKAIETHEVDDLIELFYNAVLDSAKKIDECLDYIEAKEAAKIEEDSIVPPAGAKKDRIK